MSTNTISRPGAFRRGLLAAAFALTGTALAQNFHPAESSAPLGTLAPGSNSVSLSGGVYRLQHRNPQGQLTTSYEIDVNDPDIRGGMFTVVEARSGLMPVYQGGAVYRNVAGNTVWPRNLSNSATVTFSHSRPSPGMVRLDYTERLQGLTLRKRYDVEILGKTLVVRAYAVNPRSGPNGNYMGFSTNFAKNVVNPVAVAVTLPYTLAKQVATVITGPDQGRYFFSTQADILHSNANAGPYIADRGDIPWGGGGFMYHINTSYKPMRSATAYQPLDDVIFVTVTDQFRETFPGIHRPVSPYRGDLDHRVGLDMWTLISPESLFAQPGDKQYEILDAFARKLGLWRLDDMWINWNQWARARLGGDCIGASPQLMPLSATAWTGNAQQIRTVINRIHQSGHLFSLYQNFNDVYANSPYYLPREVRIGDNGYPTSAGLGFINYECDAVRVPGTPGPAPQPFPLALEASERYAQSEGSQVKSTFPNATCFVDVTAKLHLSNLVNYRTDNAETRSYRQSLVKVYNMLDTLRDINRAPLMAEGNQGDRDVASYITPGKVEAFEGGIDGREGRPLIPDFELEVVKPHAIRFGMGYHDRWVGSDTPQVVPDSFLADYPVDKLRATTLAYGHAGFISDMPFQANKGYQGDRVAYRRYLYEFMVKEYYTFRAIQELYLGASVRDVVYVDGGAWATLPEIIDRLGSSSSDPTAAIEDFFSRPLLRVRYDNGLVLFVNRHPTRVWRVRVAGQDHFLPPNGWYAHNPNAGFEQGSELVNRDGLADRNGHRVDYVRCQDYIMVDGRGVPTRFGNDFSQRPLASRFLTVVRSDDWWLTQKPRKLPQVNLLSLAQLSTDFLDGSRDTWVSLYGQGFSPNSEVLVLGDAYPSQRVNFVSPSELRVLLTTDLPQGTFSFRVREGGQTSDPQELSIGQRTSLVLNSTPNNPQVGQVLRIDVNQGDANQPVMLFMVGLNGQPFTNLLHRGSLNGQGEYRWSRSIDSGAGNTITVQAFSLQVEGGLAASNQEHVKIQ